MSRTNDLRATIKTMLLTLCNNVYYETASDTAMYPHIVFSIKSVDLGSIDGKDYLIDIDIWHKNTVEIETLTDDVEDLFLCNNNPQTNILPTFYSVDRQNILDEDKTIKHRLVRVQTNLYER